MLLGDPPQNPFSTVSVKLGRAGDVRCTTALPPKADVHLRSCYVAFVPTRDIGANGGGDRQHIQNRAFFSINRSLARGEARRVRRPRLWLWSRMAQLTLSTKYVTVEVCNPPASARGNIEITDSGLDVRRDSVPIKLRIFIDDVCWRLIAELLVQTNFFKFVVERIGFSQIVGIAKLTDEICGS